MDGLLAKFKVEEIRQEFVNTLYNNVSVSRVFKLHTNKLYIISNIERTCLLSQSQCSMWIFFLSDFVLFFFFSLNNILRKDIEILKRLE